MFLKLLNVYVELVTSALFCVLSVIMLKLAWDVIKKKPSASLDICLLSMMGLFFPFSSLFLLFNDVGSEIIYYKLIEVLLFLGCLCFIFNARKKKNCLR